MADERKRTVVDGVTVIPDHPVAEVMQELLKLIRPHVPPGFVFLLSVEDAAGVSTCGGTCQTIEQSFELAVSTARQLMIAAGRPGLIQVVPQSAAGRRGRA
jgi:hypothetical protein